MMRNHLPTSKQLIFAPVYLNDDRHRPTWSMNVELPPEVEVEIAGYEKPDEGAVWTTIIHEALYIYRRQFWSREALLAELKEDIDEGIRSMDTEGTIAVTPEFWEKLLKRSERDVKQIHNLQGRGELGNLLLPEELHAFILERMESGECRTPTHVVCKAMPYLREERLAETAEQSKPVHPMDGNAAGDPERSV